MKKNCNILLIGGSGFIGCNFANYLLKMGKTVYLLDKNEPVFKFFNEISNKNFHFIKSDFNNLKILNYLIPKIDIIYFLSSTTTPKISDIDALFDIESNLISFVKLLEFLKDFNHIKFILISSGGAVYGEQISTNKITENHLTNPISSYGIIKLAQEKYLHKYSQKYCFSYCILRLGNPYGPGQGKNNFQGLIPNVMNKILNNQIIEISGNGDTIRDFFYINDACSALFLCIDYQNIYPRIFNIGSGKGYSVNEIVNKIEKIVGKKAILDFKPKNNYDPTKNILDISLAKKYLKWKCKYNINNGLKELYSHLKNGK